MLSTAIAKTLATLSHLKVLWNIWNLRALIALSLGFQVILILVAPFRKKTAIPVVIFTIWVSYLLADYVAILAISLFPRYSASTTTTTSLATHPDLLALWAPFLMVHLGSPDITALSLEDNELWMRTMLHLFTYAFIVQRALFQYRSKTILLVPTVLMLVAAYIKYGERILSLTYASVTKFKSSLLTDPDPGPNYAKIVDSYGSAYLRARSPPPVVASSFELRMSVVVGDDEEEERLMSRVKLVRDAFELFRKSKGLYVDMVFSLADWVKSRAYFLRPSLTPEDAFAVIEIQLNFAYDVFFTKKILIFQKGGWTKIRWVVFAPELVSLLIWIFLVDKHLYHRIDNLITCMLLVGAIVNDSMALLLTLLSERYVVMLPKESIIRASLYEKLLRARKRTWGSHWEPKESLLWPWLRRMFFRRWSESVFQLSLIDFCISPWSKRTNNLFLALPTLRDMCEGFKYVSRRWFADELRNFIFYEIRYKAEFAKDPKDTEEICNSRGDLVFRSLASSDFDPFVFCQWTTDVDYDESLLIWHIATELLYRTDGIDQRATNKRDSKTLSDYMMYLLNRQTGMIIAVAGLSDVRFRDTCAEATIFLEDALPRAKKGETKEQRLKSACEKMMQVNTHTDPRELKGDRSKSVLFDAVQLAKELQQMEKKTTTVGMWELVAKVWVELLCYAATRTSARAHAAQLKRGGELLTLVWLLMVHVGLGKQVAITRVKPRPHR